MDRKKPDEAGKAPSGKLRDIEENQRKFFVRRRSSKPLEINPSIVKDEVTSLGWHGVDDNGEYGNNCFNRY